MATLWARTVSYDSIQVGDDLPILVKHEDQQSIDNYARYAPTGPRPGWHNLHTDPAFAEQGIFGGTVNMGVATVAYVAELLEKAFPLRALMAQGSHLEMRATEPVRAGDIVTFTGSVTEKRQQDGQGLVECEVTGTNQRDQVVARARASIPFSM
jgi:acyl dehydratase